MRDIVDEYEATGGEPNLAPPLEKALLGCPFCGKQPRSSGRTTAPGMIHPYAHFVVCYCGGYGATAHKSAYGHTPEEAERNATEEWNRRA